ncbi:flagellar hook capping FlgD N-terminal domain-containing protein [Ammoniphilus sp. CFH 90114]|uniref:flagellar hook capping FlgD N-terminal domain-containing protein n=1 Tax=Ammoniphilus sp. CFH 90114 TaxID=2493665 RepID=UPI0013E934B0|nr:flagellar hook capping FlgD N-terminal domain-containing protein [Ammoniphilus sp. CFH 90114]
MSRVISETNFQDYFSKGRTLKKELGQEDFFKLLIEQLKNQDPTQPSNDLNQILNTATFGILEGVNQIKEAVADKKLNVMEYTHLVGKEITYEKVKVDTLTNQRSIVVKQATVEGVSLEGDRIILKVDDGVVFPNEIKEMNFQGHDQKHLLQDTMAYFSLVGKKIDYNLGKLDQSGIVQSVTLKNGLLEIMVGNDKFTLDKVTGVHQSLPPVDSSTPTEGEAPEEDEEQR